MLDPIIDKSISVEEEHFGSEDVSSFRNGTRDATEHPSRHYSQSIVSFDKEKVKKALTKLSIPLNTRALIIGGYTGEFAVCLRELGMDVVFTDPMEEWVENAKKAVFEAFRYPAEELPGNLMSKAQLAASFECYFPFSNNTTAIYTTLRILSLRHGGLFCESKQTINDIASEFQGKRLGQFKSALNPYVKAYNIKVNFTDAGEIRFYHFYAPTEDLRTTIVRDCACIKALYDNYPDETDVDGKVVSSLSKMIKMDGQDVVSAIERYHIAFQTKIKAHGWIANYFPRDRFHLFSKRYRLE